VPNTSLHFTSLNANANARLRLRNQLSKKSGFTLIELSIVLVIIGLLVGGVLVGQNLIHSATIRAQVSQMEKYQQAVKVFQNKYGGLPGDITPDIANNFGFITRAGTPGRGDGNGQLQGFDYGNGNQYGWNQEGELLLFWRDLSYSGLITDSFNTIVDSSSGGASGEPVNQVSNYPYYLPQSKLSSNVFVEAFSLCQSASGVISCFATGGISGENYFALTVSSSSVSGFGIGIGEVSVASAYQIDKKIDDGLPQTGQVRAFYPNVNDSYTPAWANNASTAGSTTCFDTTSRQYSITINNGVGLNCGLSFQFK